MLDLSYTIRRGNHWIKFVVQQQHHVAGFYIELDKPLIDSRGYEYVWSASADQAVAFTEAIPLLKKIKDSEESHFWVTEYGVNCFHIVAEMKVELKPAPTWGEWTIMYITHWGCHYNARIFEGAEPNLVWSMKLRISELEHVARAMRFFFKLEEEVSE
ncbi:MAG: hypothetical protein HY044_01495 [Candidatus Woesebacteria bacterium]|nr:MAG: hypothetical protein HY044_01495 [Candidatus Woesebacteria bacterium]